jgi:hypothetical protein
LTSRQKSSNYLFLVRIVLAQYVGKNSLISVNL